MADFLLKCECAWARFPCAWSHYTLAEISGHSCKLMMLRMLTKSCLTVVCILCTKKQQQQKNNHLTEVAGSPVHFLQTASFHARAWGVSANSKTLGNQLTMSCLDLRCLYSVLLTSSATQKLTNSGKFSNISHFCVITLTNTLHYFYSFVCVFVVMTFLCVSPSYWQQKKCLSDHSPCDGLLFVM